MMALAGFGGASLAGKLNGVWEKSTPMPFLTAGADLG